MMWRLGWIRRSIRITSGLRSRRLERIGIRLLRVSRKRLYWKGLGLGKLGMQRKATRVVVIMMLG